MPQKKRTPLRPPQNKTLSQKRRERDAPRPAGQRVRRSTESSGAPKSDRAVASGIVSEEVRKSSGDNQFRKPRRQRVEALPGREGSQGEFHKPGKPETGPSRKSRRANDKENSSQSATEHTDKLQKVLAQSGLGSRRDMEEAILSGRVSVNGQPARIGERVGPDDRILFDGRPVRKAKHQELPRILIYHKPEGEIVSRDDPQGRTSVFDKLPRVRGGKWVSIGRLDYNTSGLLIFTTSGELANRLSHPRFEVEREYAVRLMGELSKEQCEMLCKGVNLDDGPAKFEWLREEGGEGANHWYRVMLREGRKREVRRMFEAMGVMVSRLMRVRFGVVNLPPRLKRGEFLDLDEKQIRSVLVWAGMATSGSAPASPREPARNEKTREKRPLPRNPRAGRTQSRMRRGG